MCAHSSTAGVRVCVGACACSTNIWHVRAQPICVHRVGASVQMCASETLLVFTIRPSIFCPVTRSGLLLELKQSGQDLNGICHAPGLTELLQEGVTWLSESPLHTHWQQIT